MTTDEEKNRVYQQIKKMNKTIVILNTSLPKPQPICLFCDILPIGILDKEQEMIVKAGIYYEA